jgi:ABC-type molybdate transport system substrate-binding protein
MKTAMQELLEYLEANDRKFTYTYKKAIELLEKEKEQIISTFDNGFHRALYSSADKLDFDGEHYYNKEYNQNM